METSNLLGAGFKTLVIKMINEFNKNFNRMKKNQSEMKNTLIEMKNNLEGINNRVDEAEAQISDLEYKEEKSTQSEQQKEKRILKSEDSIRGSGTTSSVPTFELWGCLRKRERARNWKLI